MLIILSFSAIILCFYYLKHKYDYWKIRGLVTPKYYYFVGNLMDQFLFKKNTAIIMQGNYKAFDNHDYIGYYNAMQPSILIRNPEIIGDILTKDFNSFMDNDFDIDENDDPIFGKNPFILKGQRWKHVRQQATPSFTTGKIKMMLPLLKETTDKLVDYLYNNQMKEIELFPLAIRITAENVASCAFGLSGNSFTDNNAIFVDITNKLIRPTPWNVLKGFMIFLCPSLTRIMKIRFFQVSTVKRLEEIIRETLTYREEHQLNRCDFLDDMNNLRRRINNEKVFNFKDILGHAGGFLINGLLTSSSVVAYLIYNVAKHPEIQENLRKEINNILENNNELTYENIQDMLILDCVFKETLRLNPPLMYMTRRVTKKFVISPIKEGSTSPKIELEVGTPVIIPTYALQNDEKYFPKPEMFDPTRWLPENRHTITKYTYLPFGDGPRVCLGMKFGVLQAKMALITIVRCYNLKISEKTKVPLQIDPKSFLNLPVGGAWVEFNKIDNCNGLET